VGQHVVLTSSVTVGGSEGNRRRKDVQQHLFSGGAAPSRCRLIIPRRALGDGVEGVWPGSAISKRLEAASDYIRIASRAFSKARVARNLSRLGRLSESI